MHTLSVSCPNPLKGVGNMTRSSERRTRRKMVHVRGTSVSGSGLRRYLCVIVCAEALLKCASKASWGGTLTHGGGRW